jgi:hypothetical protein
MPPLQKLLLIALAATPLAGMAADSPPTAGPRGELRCGWFENPSPNNASLSDRDGEWAIAIQGKFEAQGDWPEFKESEWVSSGNASYGYGCACLRVVTNRETRRIVSILSAKVKPLAACKRDKALKRSKGEG